MSTRAEACPRCGTKVVRRPLGAGTLLLAAAIVTLLAIAFWAY